MNWWKSIRFNFSCRKGYNEHVTNLMICPVERCSFVLLSSGMFLPVFYTPDPYTSATWTYRYSVTFIVLRLPCNVFREITDDPTSRGIPVKISVTSLCNPTTAFPAWNNASSANYFFPGPTYNERLHNKDCTPSFWLRGIDEARKTLMWHSFHRDAHYFWSLWSPWKEQWRPIVSCTYLTTFLASQGCDTDVHRSELQI